MASSEHKVKSTEIKNHKITSGTLIVKNVTKSMIAEISCNAESRGATVTEMTDVNVKCKRDFIVHPSLVWNTHTRTDAR